MPESCVAVSCQSGMDKVLADFAGLSRGLPPVCLPMACCGKATREHDTVLNGNETHTTHSHTGLQLRLFGVGRGLSRPG